MKPPGKVVELASEPLWASSGRGEWKATVAKTATRTARWMRGLSQFMALLHFPLGTAARSRNLPAGPSFTRRDHLPWGEALKSKRGAMQGGPPCRRPEPVVNQALVPERLRGVA